MDFAKSLECLLNDRNMKQADLCKLTGIRSSSMSDYMSGKKSPAIKNAILIADALHISLDTLVGRELALKDEKQCQSKILPELLEEMEGLPVKEQLCLLDMAKALKTRLNVGE